MSAVGALVAGIGALIGAALGQFLGAIIGGLLASALYPEGDSGALGVMVLGMVLGTWPGGVAGCWLALRLRGHPRRGRAALILAVMIPLLAPVLGYVLPAVGLIVQPLLLPVFVALLGAAAYLFTAPE
jgi:hypothetical protein